MAEQCCEFCDQPKVFVINGVPACMDHLDEAMKPIGDALRAIRKALNE